MLREQRRAVVWKAIAWKPVWLLFVAAMISAPCFAEPKPLNWAEVTPKLHSSSEMSRKGLDQSSVQLMPMQSRESAGVNSGSKDRGSGSTSSLSTVAPNQVRTKASQENSAKNAVRIGEEGFNHFQFWLIVIIALFPLWASRSQDPCPPEFVAALHTIMGVKPNVSYTPKCPITPQMRQE